MRVCIVTSQGDLAGLGKKGLLAEIARFIEEDAIDEIYVVSHRKPRQALEGTQFYFLWSGRARLKTKICHKLFRIIALVVEICSPSSLSCFTSFHNFSWSFCQVVALLPEK